MGGDSAVRLGNFNIALPFAYTWTSNTGVVAGSGLGFGVAPPPPPAGRRRRKRSSDEGSQMAAVEHVFSRQEVDRYGLMRRIEEMANFGLQ